MPRWNEPEIVGFDVEGALDAALEVVDGPLYAFVEYDTDEFNTLYVAEELEAMYPDDETMLGHFERIHSYVHIDFSEMELFTDTIVPIADRVRYIATGMDAFTMVRFYRNHDGLFVALSADEDVDAVADAMDDVLGDV